MVKNAWVVMQKIDTWKAQISFYRFFNNPKGLCCNVKAKGIFSPIAWRARMGKAVKIHIKSPIGTIIIKVYATGGGSRCL
jgi:hypothetical protein